jgi:hypothetical protein
VWAHERYRCEEWQEVSESLSVITKVVVFSILIELYRVSTLIFILDTTFIVDPYTALQPLS